MNPHDRVVKQVPLNEPKEDMWGLLRVKEKLTTVSRWRDPRSL